MFTGGDLKVDEKANSSTTSLPDTIKPTWNNELPLQVCIIISTIALLHPRPQVTNFIATTALPGLRKFLMDNDRIASACSNIVYYIVNPAMKIKSKWVQCHSGFLLRTDLSVFRPLDLDPMVIEIIKEMTKISVAFKVWRAPVIDILYDHRVFNSNSTVATRWKPVVKALFDSDKASFGDLLSEHYIMSHLNHVLMHRY